MSDTVILVAIVVPAMVMVTLGVVAIVFGRSIVLSSRATPKGAEFRAESGDEKSGSRVRSKGKTTSPS